MHFVFAYDTIFTTKNQKFWMVTNRPEIEKNRMENGPYGFY
jgi:hypothetical protein